jgi:hypothetical protein
MTISNGVSPAIRLTIGGELVLVSAEKLAPVLQGVLPLGGDHATQIGMLLAMSVGLTEVIAALSSVMKNLRGVDAGVVGALKRDDASPGA